VLLGLIAVSAAVTLGVLLFGRLEWRVGETTVFRSRDLLRPSIALVLFTLVYAWIDRTSFARNVDRAVRASRTAAPVIALFGAAAIFWLALHYGTFAAGGADSYGYLSQASYWLGGDLPFDHPIAAKLPWPNADWTVSPLGYRPADEGHRLVPIYAPGLPLMMAAASRLFGACGPFLVAPVLAALCVWATYVLGRQLGSPVAGSTAAVLLGASPVFLSQTMFPMSDVPAAALWTIVLVYALGETAPAALAAGLVASLALVVRPNLAPVAAAVAIWITVDAARRHQWRRAVLFAAGLAPGVAIVASFNAAMYGAPWISGYGTAATIYKRSLFASNLLVYVRRFNLTQTPFVFAFVLPLLGLRPPSPVPLRARVLLGAVIAAVWLSYLFYSPFENWTYLRFLLPAIPAMLVLAVLGLAALLRPVPMPWRVLLSAAVVLLVFAREMDFNRTMASVGGSQRQEHRYIEIGRYVDRALPQNAIVFCLQHSGSIRYYSGRLTLRTDQFDDAGLASAFAWTRAQGYRPFVVLDDWELPGRRPATWRLLARREPPDGVSVYDPQPDDAVSADPPVRIVPATDRDCSAPRRLLVR
jgi:hypothetical protein